MRVAMHQHERLQIGRSPVKEQAAVIVPFALWELRDGAPSKKADLPIERLTHARREQYFAAAALAPQVTQRHQPARKLAVALV